jgi:hypothetical protein
MKTRCKLVCLVLLIGGVASAQTVTPPIAEFRGLKAEGSFQIDNSLDQPISVVLETKSFTVDAKGGVVYRPLQPGVRIDLGSSSFVIPPRDNHTVYYKAISTVSPASFSVIPTMTPITPAKGIRVNFRIPHMIYLYQKAKLAKSDVQVTVRDSKVIIVNASEKLGRVESIRVGSDDLSGFPIYPGQTREIPIAGNKATVHFEEGFAVEVR